LAGVVREQDTSRAVVGATVRVRWSQFRANGATSGLVGQEAFTILETVTDPSGFYRFCAVPRREELTVVTSLNGVDSAEQTLALSSQEEGRAHVIHRAP